MNCYQDEFDQTNGLRYLNHAAVAPWPRRAADAVSAFARENVAHGASDYPEWLKIEHRLRERLARLLNARAGSDLALVKNTSEALSFVAFGLDWREGDQVVIGNEEFPSNRVVWEALRPRGVEVVEVGLAGDDPEGALLAACGPRTRLLSISAVQYASGLRLDLERIGTGCRRRGVLFCIDAIQQLGALPFDVQAYDCAFAMADGHKWMLGPEGLGVFYCHPEQRERLALHEYGWHMLEHALDYERRDWRPARSAGASNAAARTCSARWPWRPAWGCWRRSAWSGSAETSPSASSGYRTVCREFPGYACTARGTRADARAS